PERAATKPAATVEEVEEMRRPLEPDAGVSADGDRADAGPASGGLRSVLQAVRLECREERPRPSRGAVDEEDDATGNLLAHVDLAGVAEAVRGRNAEVEGDGGVSRLQGRRPPGDPRDAERVLREAVDQLDTDAADAEGMEDCAPRRGYGEGDRDRDRER